MNYHKLLALSILFLLFACSAGTPSEKRIEGPTATIPQQFKDYWYDGNAELASYQLTQSRYGEQRAGNAVWIFVTEDFSASKQVKLDNPQQAGNEKVSVLKLNAVSKFVTGIYDYAVMQSIFTPIEVKEHPITLKTTFSSQDWCGQSFMQANFRDQEYKVKQYSYFESEGDESFSLPAAILEDELPNRIRFNPDELPTGQVEMIPAFSYARMQHKPLKVEKATATLNEFSSEEMTYSIRYENINRAIDFRFEKAFPHYITHWRIKDGNQPETTAELVSHERLPYWQLNGKEDKHWRDSLKIAH
jgi:hypothetical protein